MRMFLETCVTEDGAGQQWIEYVVGRIRAHLHQLYPGQPFTINTDAEGHNATTPIPGTGERIRTTVTEDGALQLIGNHPDEDPTTWGPIGIVDLDCTSTRYD
jgi:hypothetical protein